MRPTRQEPVAHLLDEIDKMIARLRRTGGGPPSDRAELAKLVAMRRWLGELRRKPSENQALEDGSPGRN